MIITRGVLLGSILPNKEFKIIDDMQFKYWVVQSKLKIVFLVELQLPDIRNRLSSSAISLHDASA